MVHAIGCVEPDWISTSGHGVNSQFGCILTTTLPSGHTFASSVQDWDIQVGVVAHPEKIMLNKSKGIRNFFIENDKRIKINHL